MSDKSKKNKAVETKVDQDAHNAVSKKKKNTSQTPQTESVLSVVSQKKRKKNKKTEANGVPKTDKDVKKETLNNDLKEQTTQNVTKLVIQNIAPKKKSKKKKSKVDSKVSASVENKDLNIVKDDSQFRLYQIKSYVTLSPCFSNDLTSGINEFLNCYIFKYLDVFKGIVLLHTDTRYLQNKGLVLYDSPFINFWITTQLLIWRPKVGSKITGAIQLQSVDHIGLILFGTFNAVINANELPSHYIWSGSENQEGEWVNSNTKEPLVNCSNLDFFVKSFSPSQDTLTIMGTLID